VGGATVASQWLWCMQFVQLPDTIDTCFSLFLPLVVNGLFCLLVSLYRHSPPHHSGTVPSTRTDEWRAARAKMDMAKERVAGEPVEVNPIRHASMKKL